MNIIIETYILHYFKTAPFPKNFRWQRRRNVDGSFSAKYNSHNIIVVEEEVKEAFFLYNHRRMWVSFALILSQQSITGLNVKKQKQEQLSWLCNIVNRDNFGDGVRKK